MYIRVSTGASLKRPVLQPDVTAASGPDIFVTKVVITRRARVPELPRPFWSKELADWLRLHTECSCHGAGTNGKAPWLQGTWPEFDDPGIFRPSKLSEEAAKLRLAPLKLSES